MSVKLQEDFKQKVLDGYYISHPQGDCLLEIDMEAVITEAVIEKEIQTELKDERETQQTESEK